MQTEPLLQWSEVATEYASFVASFLATGAVGFRYSAARGRVGRGGGADAPLYQAAAQRAAACGLVGVIVQALLLATRLPEMASRRHVTVAQTLTTMPLSLQAGLLALAVIGFILASARSRVGWTLAAVGVIGAAFTGLASGQIARLVNPMHVLSAGLWIGTLFVLLIAGLPIALGTEGPRARRGTVVADMVNGFSPLALVAGGSTALFGVITAWRHLPTISALWTTPYGWALIVKLALVAVVFALGAWNWRRMRPSLGTDAAALGIRRSATVEIGAAALVLVATAILVSLPSPRRPGAPGGPGGPGGPPGGGPGGPPPAGAPPAP